MRVKTVFGLIFLLFGFVSFCVGIGQIIKGATPDTCIVSFSRSLGGKASFDHEQSLQQAKYRGTVGASLGVVFCLGGSLLLVRSRK